MKKILFVVFVIFMLFMTSCGNTCYHPILGDERIDRTCIPYCVAKNMSANLDNSMICGETIQCQCEGYPVDENEIERYEI